MELKLCNELKYPSGFNGIEWNTESLQPPKRKKMSFYLKQNLPDQKLWKIRTLFQKFNVPRKRNMSFQQDVNISNKQSSEKKEKITNLFQKLNTTVIPDRTYFEIFLNRQFSQKRKQENYNKQQYHDTYLENKANHKQETRLSQQNSYENYNISKKNQKKKKQRNRDKRNNSVIEPQNKQLFQIQEAKKVLYDELSYMKIFADKNSNMKHDCIDQLTLYNKLETILSAQLQTETIIHDTIKIPQIDEYQQQLQQRKQLKTANQLVTGQNRKEKMSISNNTSFLQENEVRPMTTNFVKNKFNRVGDLSLDTHAKQNNRRYEDDSIQVINEKQIMSSQQKPDNFNYKENMDDLSFKDKLVIQRQKNKQNTNDLKNSMNDMVEKICQQIQEKKQNTSEEKFIKRRQADPQQLKMFAKNHTQYENISQIKQRRKELCDKFFIRKLGLPFDDPLGIGKTSKNNNHNKSTNHSTIQTHSIYN